MPKTLSERRMVLVSLHIPMQMLQELDSLVKTGVYPSRSEAIRVAIRDLILREKGKTKGGGDGEQGE
jgi:Arc/MetJ-type ribon-helix-helix transcriptional regulator